MKLTKKIEAEIRKVYQAFWDSYLSGDVKTMGTFLTDDFSLIGTSDGEVFNNKKSAMKYLKATINQVAGVLSKKNIEIKITQVDDTILVNEFSDAYIKLDGTPSFYDKFRVTTVMKQVRSKWKIIHQHGSLPDSKAAVGETLATEKVKKENRELREAVKRRTHELELKNRDLEIEAALERVRGRTMAMHRSDELREVVNVLYEQLRQLGFRYGGANIALMDPDSGDMHWWMSGFGLDEFPDSYLVKYFNHPALDEMLQRWKKGEKFASITLAGKSKKKFDQSFLFKSDFRRIPEEIKLQLANLESATFSLAYMKYGALNIGAEPITIEQAEILQRFAIVFEQTYTRFLDLKKAEAQAQESQIQLALERVRARTMAMQHSDELQEAANLLFKQVQSLEIPVWSCGYNIWEKHEKVCTGWMSTHDAIQPPFRIPLTESPTFIRFYKSRQKNEDFYVEKVEGKALAAHYKYMLSLLDFAKDAEEHLKAGFSFPESQLNHVANFAHGNLIFITSEPVPDAWEIFKRFAKVFEQTYTRFLDLKKAEAQVREAQIEAALEKVRSTSMGMRQSDELEKVVAVLFDKLSELGLSFDGALIFLFDKAKRNIQHWIATSHLSAPINIIQPYEVEIANNTIIEDLRRGEDIINRSYSGTAKDDYFRYTARHNESKIPETIRKFVLEQKEWTVSFAVEKNSVIAVDSWLGQTTTIENFQILKRFARVFEQAYVRFLDLQNAEAQAREAQIEAALEKVRSTSMGMHHSDELEKVVGVLFDKLSELGLSFDGALIYNFDKGNRDIQLWVASKILPAPVKVKLPHDDEIAKNPIIEDLWRAIERGEPVLNKSYSGKVKDDYFLYVAKNNANNVPQVVFQAESYTISFAAEKNSIVGFDSWTGQMTSDQDFQVIRRFAGVFEQAYTRFLDLQRAEAQARESQIQLALERVRARTMAMYVSSDLAQISALLFDQLKQLGVSMWVSGFSICREDSVVVEKWMTRPDGKIMDTLFIPYTEDPSEALCYEVWKNGVELHAVVVGAEEIRKGHEHYRNTPSMKIIVERMEELGLELPHWCKIHTAAFKHGYLSIVTTAPFEETQIFVRFAKVFEQTYTRFLDLKNAEALARETQIQLALERVRARTMAMQKSHELADVAELLFQQVSDLGIKTWTTGFNIWLNEDTAYEDWITNPQGGFIEPYIVDTTQFPIFIGTREAKQRGDEFLVQYVDGELIEETYKELTRIAPTQFEKLLQQGFKFPSRQYDHFVFGSKVSLMFITYEPVPEAHDIFKRFGKAFEQTYTRFLDLEKAEAQARESQIQLALERVRARTMAMQKSDELKEVAMLLFKQVADLGITCWTTGFNVWSEDGNSYVDYVTNPVGGFMEPYTVDTTTFAVIRDVSAARKKGETFYVRLETGDRQKETYAHLNEFGDKDQYGKILESGFQFPSQQVNHFVFGSKVSLMFITYEPVPESHDIFKRFGKVFEQTYTRFLDLKKAEAQAREAHIEAALEKVRARTMGMQRSDELAEAAVLMFQQVKSFGLESWGCGFNIWDKDDTECAGWMSTPDGKSGSPRLIIPLTEHPLFIRFKESRKNGVEFWVQEMHGSALVDLYTYMSGVPILGELLKDFTSTGVSVPTFQINHVVNFAHGNLIFITYEPCPEAHDIFKRFGKVFEQTYTRFLDLQNAEAQARESQIQLALERVRARTMAMQRSEELNDVAILLFQQVSQLGIKVWTTGFNGWSDDNNSYIDYITSPQGSLIEAYSIDVTEYPVFVEIANARKSGVEFWVQYLEGEMLKGTHAHLRKSGNKRYEKMVEEGFQFPSHQYNHFVFGSRVSVMFNTYEPVPEAHDIFIRFGKVFEQTYTRFLDLKNAEAQAREAQIEAALEKVRSSSLAMHHSDELEKVLTVLFDKLLDLGLNIDGAAINIFDKGKRSSQAWVATKFLSGPVKVNLPYDEEITKNAIIADMWRALETGEHVFNRSYSGNAKDDYFSFIFKHNESKIPDATAKFHLEAANWTVTWASAPNSIVLLDSWSGKLSSDEDFQVLKRFSRVFDQAYTRFLDLQKAEAQAREAHIEAALERVRSRTMAMHKSDELLDVIAVVSEQLQHVGIKFNTVSFGKNSISFDMEFWVAGSELKSPIKISAPYTDIPMYNRLRQAHREGKSFFSDTFTAEETRVWNQHIIDYNPELFSRKSRDYLTSRPGTSRTAVLLKNVFLFLINHDFVTNSNEDIEIVIRFAKVFEQTYTRFLDLQKAEAQAREAQIEAALERLRSRTMAMQRSTELAEVSQLLHRQFLSLGVQTITCAFMFPNEEKKTQSGWTVLPDGTLLPTLLNFPLLGDAILDERYNSWKEKRPMHRKVLDVEENRRHHQFLSEQVASHISKDIFTQLPDQLTFTNANFAQGYLMTFTTAPLAAEEENILVRFAKVFEQTYTRFLDLQKAEAQAREAQIEAALERVRSRAMAMHTAQQLSEVVHELRKQMGLLGQKNLETCVIHLNDESPDFIEAWAASRLPNRSDEIQEFHVMIPKRGLRVIEEALAAYNADGKDYVILNDGAKLDEWMEFMRNTSPAAYSIMFESTNSMSQEIIRGYWSFADFQGGSMLMVTLAEPDETSRALLRRFANVFGLAYRRFADLKQAEEQAREAQIETALEKIRSRSLAMHHSGELKDVVAIVFEKMTELNVVLGTIAIQLFDQSSMSSIFWPANNLDEPRLVKLPYDERMMNEDTYHRDSWQAKIRSENIINKEYSLEQKTKYFDYAYAHNDLSIIQEVTREFVAQAKGNIVCLITQKNSALFADSWNGQFYSEESIKVLTRASKVFEQAYVRFLDLQKAEAQARESTIEAALEKIRSRSLGMHKSEEIKDVVAILFEKLKELGLVFDGGAAITLFSEGSRDASILVAAPQLVSEPVRQYLPYDENDFVDNPIILDVWRARETGESIVNKHYPFEEKNKYFQYVFKHNPETPPEEVRKFILDANSYTATFISEKNSLLGANSWTEQKFSEDDVEVLKRVARVFEQAYVRFLDLQKAEAQAREATIEAALEKIRSRSLGMHQSDEIKDVVAILCEKLKELDLPFDGGAGLYLFPEGSRDIYLWVTNLQMPAPVGVYLPYDEDDFSDNSIMQDVWKAKDTGEPIVCKHYSPSDKDKLFEYTTKHNVEASLPEEVMRQVAEAKSYTATFIPEKNCLLSVDSWTKLMMSAGDIEILKRVARVFEQAYVRFLDLQKAEVHAREVVCQASLDRVRAEIASMRTVEDLDRITPLIWRELNTIGIPFIRCGVFIMDETNRVVHTFLSTPEGKAIAVFQLPFDTSGRLGRIVPFWQDKKIFLDYWDEVAMRDVADILVAGGIFSSSQQYLDTLPKEGFHLHFLPFAQGMLYVANLTKLKDEELTLLQSLADAFATAYARYDDFNKLESAKQQVDRTLVDLKQAQQQLVQSEKMASLGELTAGIAHEIQNPLNFVNNFSEVSNELIDEMKTELHAGNLKEAAELAQSIKQNLEKITHHGKRADGIVKGMLQHSRAGSGQKEPTDLNFLCDEYLRLAYHGYRAKEKSFNAKFESSFDPTLPKVNVVGQDIGRVILNLINNAFYAVTEMKRQKVDGYEPIVSVITKNLSGKVEIRVKDNGIGISEKVLEKIFPAVLHHEANGPGNRIRAEFEL